MNRCRQTWAECPRGRFRSALGAGRHYDGTTCRASGATALTTGPIWVTLDNRAAGQVLGVIVALHPGATWRQVEAYAATYRDGQAPPDFADLITIPQLGPGIASILTLSPGMSGIACGALDQGAVTRVVLSDPFVVAP